MNTKTISHCQGKGSISHNNREFHPKNVNSSRTKDNVTFIKIPIETAYEKLFGAAVERYNAKQKRSDRKIKNGYYEYQFKRKISQNSVTSSDKRKSFYEDVVQIGTMNDTAVGTSDAETARKCLTEYMERFQQRNPNFFVFNAVLHMDEATPHLHIDYIPVGHYKRGVDTQNGLAQALKEMGYGEGKDAIAKWRKSECDILHEICAKNGIEIADPKKGRGYSYSVEEYKAHQQKLNDLRSEIDEYRQVVLQAENTEFTHTKMPFGKSIVSDKNLDELTEKLKAAAVAEKDVLLREKELSDREKMMSEKEEYIDVLTEKAEKLNRSAIAREHLIKQKEERAYDLLHEQENLNRLYNQKVSHCSDLERKVSELTNKCSYLNDVIDKAQKRLSEIKNEMKKKLDEVKTDSSTEINSLNAEIDRLKKDRRKLCRYIADAAMAVSVLGHKTYENEEFFAALTAKQRSIILGTVDFCHNIADNFGYHDIAQEIGQIGGMSDEIRSEYEKWYKFFSEQTRTNYERQEYSL